MTNNSSSSRMQYVSKFRSMLGIDVQPEQVRSSIEVQHIHAGTL